MTDAPSPPTPAEADLRGMPYMPFKGDRAFTSTTWVTASPEGRCAALRLWWHSFAKEVPAGSLPEDDRLLAEYSGYGVAVKAWLKIKAEAMRGWFKCSDGRLYHNVVAEVVAEAWAKRADYEAAREKWREKKRRQRGLSPDTSPGTNSNVPEKSPGKTLLSEEKRSESPLPPKTNPRHRGTNPRALAPRPVSAIVASTEHQSVEPPAGMRHAATTNEYVEYMREKHNDPKLSFGDWRLSKWQFVPLDWKPKAA